ncbi:MAG: hypothetical protein LJE70_20560 [Chromatiaceae bacterium]|jgi:uncharacterized membrane protein YkoI|nr:hypothetical protein [Chromatiaceae bacterium]
MRHVLAIGIVALALAGICQGDDYEEAYRLRERREILPLEELLRQHDLGPGSRILEIETEFEHGRPLYEIEYLDDSGRIREILIDPRTGQALPHGEDD